MQGGWQHWGDHMWGDHMGGGWMVFWWLLGLAVVAVVVWAAIRLANRPPQPPSAPPRDRRESAEEILERRYARGEIDREQYREMRDELRRV